MKSQPDWLDVLARAVELAAGMRLSFDEAIAVIARLVGDGAAGEGNSHGHSQGGCLLGAAATKTACP